MASFKANKPEALDARLLARIVELERQIAELQAEFASYDVGHAASVLNAIAAKADDADMDDGKFRKFVQWLVR